jgi:hypothetical protein
MAGRTVTVQVAGPPERQGSIRLSEFTKKLEAIKHALRETERLEVGIEQPVLDYRIIDVKRTSPFTVTIEASPLEKPRPQGLPDPSIPVVRRFFRYARQVKDKHVPHDIDLPALQAFKEMAAMLDRHISEVVVANDQDRISLDRDFFTTIDDYIGPDEMIEGSIEGVLEKVNLHNTHKFYIYPTVGPKQVECDFRPDLRPKVKEGLDCYVRVEGTLRYKWLSPYPHAITATDIETYPPEDQLPTILDLRGIAPDATDGLAAEEFVERIRGRSPW